MNQYDSLRGEFVTGDNGIPLPFVKTIMTLAKSPDRDFIEGVQVPGVAPQQPTYLGAEAIFLPREDLNYQGKVLDYDQLDLTNGTVVGYMYGGILATAPTSSSSSPTFASSRLFEVIVKARP